jgi:hypothetical protein
MIFVLCPIAAANAILKGVQQGMVKIVRYFYGALLRNQTQFI